MNWFICEEEVRYEASGWKFVFQTGWKINLKKKKMPGIKYFASKA